MECKEVCGDVRKSFPEERKEGQRQTQLLFQINHTMPHTEEYDHIMIINNEILEPYYKIESGYYRFKDGHVESFKNLDIQERTTYRGFADAEKYIVIGVQEHCSIISENDQWIEQLQEHETLSPEIMRDLQKNISKNKTYNVRLGI